MDFARRVNGLGAEYQKMRTIVENPQPGTSAIEKTDEEIWRAIRDLDPDQRRQVGDIVAIVVIAVICLVWYYLIFAGK